MDRRSERIHGPSRERLDAGLSPAAAAAELNVRLDDFPTIWCDEARNDEHWSGVLFATALLVPARSRSKQASCAIDSRALALNGSVCSRSPVRSR